MSTLTRDTYLEYQGIARILHNVLFFDPSVDLIGSFIAFKTIESWPEYGLDDNESQTKQLINNYLKHWSQEQRLSLKLDYGQLFYGPGDPSAAPWGSVYLSEKQLLNGESTLSLMNFYRERGIRFELESNQPIDHLGLFFAVLDPIFGQLAEEDNPELVGSCIILLQQHLLPWSDRCLELMHHHAESDFYRGIALLTKSYLLQLTKSLQIVPISAQLFR
ncbi:molecular chaperone TorD [Shewanella canadensis]|uniref:Molecular chaperone TorD n=1 Tax=Shewanella canadensis TaxID=271096 RepID=A0A431WMT9_9GAMM|nr:molecular chaperone TorD family protein [Shewanella canadensis]RTR36761.1 molecular chaperone TorD [Shewanella canadensis]